jgi:hypothetical protein
MILSSDSNVALLNLDMFHLPYRAALLIPVSFAKNLVELDNVTLHCVLMDNALTSLLLVLIAEPLSLSESTLA